MSRFENILNRIYEVLGLQKDSEFCEKFDIKPNTLSTWKKRDKIPYELIEQIAEGTNIPLDFLIIGKRKIDPDFVQIMGRANRMQNNDDFLESFNEKTIDNIIKIPKLSAKVSAGYNIQQIDSVEKIGELILDLSIFKTPPPKKLFAMQVDGYSMIPMIFPDSWVVFDDSKEFRGDGLYIINWDDCLMVKQISATPKKGVIQIISANKDYQSWEVDLNDTQCSFIIFGKVIRTIL